MAASFGELYIDEVAHRRCFLYLGFAEIVDNSLIIIFIIIFIKNLCTILFM